MTQLQQIEQYFKVNGIPEGDVKLDRATTVVDPVLFVEASIRTLKSNPGNKTYAPYFNRLLKYYQLVSRKAGR